jgi:hypothetical protein
MAGKQRSLPCAGRLLLSCHTKQSKLIPLREVLLNLLCMLHADCHNGAKNSQERKKIQIFLFKEVFWVITC